MLNPAVTLADQSEALDLWATLPRWINRHNRVHGDWNFAAREIVAQPTNVLPLAVEVRQRHKLIATYKCNISEVHGHRRSWLVFAPLIIIREPSCNESGKDLRRAMMDHLVLGVRAFHQAQSDLSRHILIASGNLTVAKEGKPFFERLGWEIVFPGTRRPHHLYDGENACPEPLTAVAEQIEAAIAPLRSAGKVDDQPVSFAILRFG